MIKEAILSQETIATMISYKLWRLDFWGDAVTKSLRNRKRKRAKLKEASCEQASQYWKEQCTIDADRTIGFL